MTQYVSNQSTNRTDIAKQQLSTTIPEDINFKDHTTVVKYLRFLSTAQSIAEKRHRLKMSMDGVSLAFYAAFAQAKEFRGLLLLKKWLLEGRDKAEWAILRDVMSLLEKLPISIEGLASTKLGRVVVGLGKMENADDTVKEISIKLTKKWTSVIAEQNPPSTPALEKKPTSVNT
ncbi:hypothetical protein BCR33DRAFT_740623 [Rhizoclosmatium globosum]|uniref:TFIIS N-terminal domain-containing protein n=1 Tax=Rhizoclosmatium globosum TaxID=329046 RepID=A0A1Y2BYV9_9FUNG|nr:hypothetical protein BCR33DRAFT_740623 [Rhizoclosmatium globosum]|eukprot:ORY39953.1 hypothetical protein BCR33DRAFT_740623 [Rhizoclosmatium globosum]